MAGQAQLFFMTRFFIVLVLVLGFGIDIHAQQVVPKQHGVYPKIKRIAEKHKLTKLAYDAVFVSSPTTVLTDQDENITKSNKQKRKDPNSRYAGRIIKKIEIIVYDPFGHSVNDTMSRKINSLQKIGNKIHLSTRKAVVHNLLLFSENEALDILEISESERILREARYVGDARIWVSGSKNVKDSVDVVVIVHDRWSWDLQGGLSSPTGGSAVFRDRNFAGLGLLFEQFGSYDYKTGNYNYKSQYSVNSIGNSYISSTLYYTDEKEIAQAGISFDRPFYSPLAKWAGGASETKTWTYFKYRSPDSVSKASFLDYINSDYWIGHSFNPGKKGSNVDKKSQNIGIAFRYANLHHSQRPFFKDIDTGMVNVNSSLYLGSLAYSKRKYYKDKYIYRFGANEDVPEGSLVQLTYGVRDLEQHKLRYYLGLELSTGRHVDGLGYLSSSLSYGSFFNKSEKKEAALNAGLFYFSDLFRLGRWKVRQFLKYKLVYGFNKPPKDYINLRPEEMDGFDIDTLRGSRKMVLSMETVLYAPYRVVGFSFAPVLLFSFGVLNAERSRFFDTQVYQTYALGLLIRNENLVASSLQVSAGYYPYLAGNSNQSFKMNPVTTFTLKVYGFAISKPSPVAYQ